MRAEQRPEVVSEFDTTASSAPESAGDTDTSLQSMASFKRLRPKVRLTTQAAPTHKLAHSHIRCSHPQQRKRARKRRAEPLDELTPRMTSNLRSIWAEDLAGRGESESSGDEDGDTDADAFELRGSATSPVSGSQFEQRLRDSDSTVTDSDRSDSGPSRRKRRRKRKRTARRLQGHTPGGHAASAAPPRVAKSASALPSSTARTPRVVRASLKHPAAAAAATAAASASASASASALPFTPTVARTSVPVVAASAPRVVRSASHTPRSRRRGRQASAAASSSRRKSRSRRSRRAYRL